MATVFTFRMPAGIPGQVSRELHSTVEPQIMLSTNPLTAYGLPAVLDASTTQMRPAAAGDTAASVYGFLVRPFPTTTGTIGTGAGFGNFPLGGGTPNPSGTCNILVRGYIIVQLNGTTAAAKGGPVYVRIATAGAGKPIGGVEAAADSTNTVVLARTYFMGPADATGAVEIAFNI